MTLLNYIGLAVIWLELQIIAASYLGRYLASASQVDPPSK